MTHRIVCLEHGTLPEPTVLHRPTAPHEWREYPMTEPGEVVERLRGATIAVINKSVLDRAVLEQLPELRMIAVTATGTDCVDVDCCRERGITVSNVRNYAVHTVPEHTMALILALRRSLLAYADDVRRGEWERGPYFCLFTYPIKDLHGSRIGIIGGGSIGGSVAKLATAFGMDVVFLENPYEEKTSRHVSKEELLATSDVITLHCPLTPETRNIIAAPDFRAMKRRPLLINTARGGLVDEAALEDALDQGLIAGAGFDVLSPEPPPADHPLLLLARRRSNFILSPHIAWASAEAIQEVADQTTRNIEGFIRGTPTNVVVGAA